MSKKKLTARAVKAMLTRAGVDYSTLDIRDDSTAWTDAETGQPHAPVVIAGPENARRPAFWALFDRGLAHAPYPDKDEWFRPDTGRAQAEAEPRANEMYAEIPAGSEWPANIRSADLPEAES